MLDVLKNLFRTQEKRTTETEFEAIMTGNNVDNIAIEKREALNIPAVATCVEFIANTIAGLPVRMYTRDNKGDIKELENDYRLKLLNAETGDLLDAFQWKKSLITDYLLDGNGYSYINRKRNEIVSLNYVSTDYVSISTNADPIFKEAVINIGGNRYREFEVLRLLRDTRDGVTGVGVLQQHPLLFKTMYNALKYENNAISYGTKRGFLQSKYKLTAEALEQLKSAWKKLYSTEINNTPDVMILNEGVSFEPASSTAVENQMNESKQSNSDLVYNVFNLSSALFASANSANVDNQVYTTCVKMAILPVIEAFNTALNKFLLLETEKNNMFFMIDTTEILKASILEQFQSYDIGIKGGWLQVDEVRKLENMQPLGLDFVKLSLADVLYYPDKKEIYTANTNASYTIGAGGMVQANDTATDSEDKEPVVKGVNVDNEN